MGIQTELAREKELVAMVTELARKRELVKVLLLSVNGSELGWKTGRLKLTKKLTGDQVWLDKDDELGKSRMFWPSWTKGKMKTKLHFSDVELLKGSERKEVTRLMESRN